MNINSLTLQDILMILIGLILAVILLRLIFGSIKKIAGLMINSVLGAILLMIVNYFGAYFGISVGINLLTAIIAGVFGIPGILFLIVFQNFIR
ncbi:MAG: pro-sigmaK processing inhibitor BofA family protein [Clostridium perfringens]|nr:pro-sigmaK processing inhibitor BofA family protein [Clostridium perfringens]